MTASDTEHLRRVLKVLGYRQQQRGATIRGWAYSHIAHGGSS